jgi:hypothetical protein
MDPNSTHQTWSEWRVTITEPLRWPDLPEVRDAARRFARAVFQSTTGQLRVDRARDGYDIRIRIEGPIVNDQAYVTRMGRTWHERFTRPGFGGLARTQVTARLLAGSPEDGRPRAQLIVAPPLALEPPCTT